MVTLESILTPERVHCHVPTASRKRTLQELGSILANSDPTLTPNDVFDQLVARSPALVPRSASSRLTSGGSSENNRSRTVATGRRRARHQPQNFTDSRPQP